MQVRILSPASDQRQSSMVNPPEPHHRLTAKPHSPAAPETSQPPAVNCRPEPKAASPLTPFAWQNARGTRTPYSRLTPLYDKPMSRCPVGACSPQRKTPSALGRAVPKQAGSKGDTLLQGKPPPVMKNRGTRRCSVTGSTRHNPQKNKSKLSFMHPFFQTKAEREFEPPHRHPTLRSVRPADFRPQHMYELFIKSNPAPQRVICGNHPRPAWGAPVPLCSQLINQSSGHATTNPRFNSGAGHPQTTNQNQP